MVLERGPEWADDKSMNSLSLELIYTWSIFSDALMAVRGVAGMAADDAFLSSGSGPRRAGQRLLRRRQEVCAGCSASGSGEYVETDEPMSL